MSGVLVFVWIAAFWIAAFMVGLFIGLSASLANGVMHGVF